MIEEYLKLFNDCLDTRDYDKALYYIDKIFIDKKYLKVKNLLLYLLGCITELPDKTLDYVKTIFNYDLLLPIKNADMDIIKEKNFYKNVLCHSFSNAKYTYYEWMDDAYSKECNKALINLLNLAIGVKKKTNRVLGYLFNNKDYYSIYSYVEELVHKYTAYNNIFILYILLHDYISKDYYTSDMTEYNDLSNQIKHKNYEKLLERYQNINCKLEDNYEIVIIVDVLKNIIEEKEQIKYQENKIDKKSTNIDKDMFLDFLISVEDIVDKEGFVILNPECEEVNDKMRNLVFCIPTLGSYKIGGKQKQVVINKRRDDSIANDELMNELKREAYKKGDSMEYIDITLELLKYIIPSENDASRLSQSYFRLGLIDEGLRTLKLAIGLKEYEHNATYTCNMLNYYMMQDYFMNKKNRTLAQSRQK